MASPDFSCFAHGELLPPEVVIGDDCWERGSILLSVGEAGPEQIRLRGGRNRDLMKRALQETRR